LEKNGMNIESQLAGAALDTLHGARELPADEAASRLRDFLNSISSHIPGSQRLSGASDALNNLVRQLETNGAAADDDWLAAIDTMTSLANDGG
jgi:hypothetical protein